jgi:hypothetical protein
MQHDLHDGLQRGWPRLEFGQAVICRYSKDKSPAKPYKPRPCLVFDFAPKSEDDPRHVTRVIYGTSIRKPEHVEKRRGDGLALTLLHPKSWRSTMLDYPTIFQLSRSRAYGYGSRFFVPSPRNTPVLGRLAGPEWWAFLDIFFIDGFENEDDRGAHWRSYDGPLYGTIQRFRPRPDAKLREGVVLSTPWRQADGAFVEIAPFSDKPPTSPEWLIHPLKLTHYEKWGPAKPIPIAFPRKCTVDFARATTLPLSTLYFPNMPRWSKLRLTLKDRCYARSLWAGWQRDFARAAAHANRHRPSGWSLPQLKHWP